jgi:hypothetical protein
MLLLGRLRWLTLRARFEALTMWFVNQPLDDGLWLLASDFNLMAVFNLSIFLPNPSGSVNLQPSFNLVNLPIFQSSNPSFSVENIGVEPMTS